MLQPARVVKWIVFGALLAIVIAALGLLWQLRSAVKIQVGSGMVSARVADTEAARVRGLSGTSPLGTNEAMLFVFDKADTWEIWMKDMRYNLDIIWLDDYQKVVHIVEQATPQSYPRTFQPAEPARYVIELPAGYVRQHSVVVGSVVSIRGYQ